MADGCSSRKPEKNRQILSRVRFSRYPGGSEHTQSQLYRALRYHTLQDPQLHNTLKNLLATVKAPGKGLSTAARLYLSRRKFTLECHWSKMIVQN